MNRRRDELGGLSLTALGTLEFTDLGRFKAAQSFPHGYDRDYLTFYAPRDTGVHQVLLQTPNSRAVPMPRLRCAELRRAALAGGRGGGTVRRGGGLLQR